MNISCVTLLQNITSDQGKTNGHERLQVVTIVVLLHIENPLILPVNVVISTYMAYVFAARIRKWEGEISF